MTRFGFWSTASMAIITLNFILYILTSIQYDRELPSESLKKLIEPVTYDSLNEMYQQTLDPLFAKELIKNQDGAFLRDQNFWHRALTFPFKGDLVQIDRNKKLLSDLSRYYKSSSQSHFGLGQEPSSPWVWLTYQFTHAGFFHLMTNMLFLFLIGPILLKRISDEMFFLVYLFSGFSGGLFYLMMNPNTNTVNVVGASGSLCGLMAFLTVIEHHRNIPWTYFLSPMKGSYGLIYMPAYFIFPIYLMADFTTVLWQQGGLSGAVANSAHIGGNVDGANIRVCVFANYKNPKTVSLRERNLCAWCSQ